MAADACVDIHGWTLPVTRFTPEEFVKAVRLRKRLKNEGLSHSGVLRTCGETGRQVLNLVFASIHRADPTLSLAAVSTVIYDLQDLMTVCRRISLLTVSLLNRGEAHASALGY